MDQANQQRHIQRVLRNDRTSLSNLLFLFLDPNDMYHPMV